MGFAKYLETIRDPDQPSGRRYMSLRHALEKISVFGFDGTWKALCERCGVPIDRGRFSNEAFLTAAAFLEELHTQRQRELGAYSKLRRAEKRRGQRTPGASTKGASESPE